MSLAISQSATHNPDLQWELSSLSMQERALLFFKYFENRICVFSPSVSQLYSNYSFFLPENHQKNLVVLPDPYAFQDTFHRIPSKAVQATNLHIIQGEYIGRDGLHLIMEKKDKTWSGPLKFTDGLEQLLKRFHGNDPFLPVLLKGDLRELNTEVPSLHLHRLRLPNISELSPLQKQNIKNVISNKLMGIYRDALEARQGMQ